MLQHLGATELAESLGVSRQSVYRAEKYGRIKRESSGLFDLEKVRRDWSSNTDLKMNGASRCLSEGQDEREPSEHPAFEQLQATWNNTLGAMALCLRDLGQLDSQATLRILGVLFLFQWKALSDHLEIPDDQPFKFRGSMLKLVSAKGPKDLVKWLDSQPVIDWEGKQKERVVNGKTACGFKEGTHGKK